MKTRGPPEKSARNDPDPVGQGRFANAIRTGDEDGEAGGIPDAMHHTMRSAKKNLGGAERGTKSSQPDGDPAEGKAHSIGCAAV
jgi:hypothetical protein